MKPLKGKNVWITGSKRIGKSIATTLASLGADLIISYRSSKNEAQDIVNEVKKFNVKTLLIKCDVSSRESVIEAVREIKKEMKNINILILLASIFKPTKLQNINEDDWDKNLSTHIKGTFWPIQLSLPLMKKGSHIITISDRTALGKAYSGYLPYIVSKGAVSIMTKALAVEIGGRGIFINSIAPGPILKPDNISQSDWQKIRDNSIIKYPITDEEAIQEFVDTVVRLSSVRSSGTTYPLDLGHI